MSQFAGEILNTSGVRDVLRRRIPQIDRLEKLESLGDLRLTGMKVGEEELIFMAFYEGIATTDLYPHVNANLIRQGVINRGNVIYTSHQHLGQSSDHESIGFGVSGSSIQVVLKVFNPDYNV